MNIKGFYTVVMALSQAQLFLHLLKTPSTKFMSDWNYYYNNTDYNNWS